LHADQIPSARWGHALCMTSESEAVIIGGQGDKNMLCKDAVWQLDMCSYSQISTYFKCFQHIQNLPIVLNAFFL